MALGITAALAAATLLGLADHESASARARHVSGGQQARGHAVIEAALAELGGATAVRAHATWDVEGKGRENLSAEVQGAAPERATWREHHERVAVDAATLTVAWQRRTPRVDHSVRWRRLIYGPDSSGFVDLATSTGAMRGAAATHERRRGIARRVPHLLLLHAATAGEATWLGEAEVDGHTHDLVTVRTPDEAPITLHLSRAPVYLRRAEYVVAMPTRGDVTVAWEWTGWAPDERLGARPAGHVVRVDGELFQDVRYLRYEAGRAIDALLTAAESSPFPSGAPLEPVPAATGFAATGEVAPGVHVTSVFGFRVMAVEFEEFIVAVEAPEAPPGLEAIPAALPTSSVAASLLDWLRQVAGGRPIRFAVVSHHHGDHMGAVPALVAAGARILVSPGDVGAAVRAVASHGAGAAPTDDSGGVGLAVEGVPDTRVIQDATRRLEVIQVGTNPHTDENLVVWLPAERILFQGDLFYFADGAPFPPAGRATMNRYFSEWIAARGLEPLAVYGVHNAGAAGPAALARAR